MGSLFVVDLAPLFEFIARIVQVAEVVLVEAFVAQFAIEALYVAVLHWLAGLDEAQLDFGFLAPFQHRFGSEFGQSIHSSWPSSLNFRSPSSDAR